MRQLNMGDAFFGEFKKLQYFFYVKRFLFLEFLNMGMITFF